MKTIITFAAFILLSVSVSGQSQARYQTYQSKMKIIAIKQGQEYQWENKNITVLLDYQNGDFLVKLRNSDFLMNALDSPDTSEIQDITEYQLRGIFPIRAIINQKQINQHYNVELQLVNDERDINNTLRFDLEVTNPGTTRANYRIFILQGILYNNEVHIPAFAGFDNDITIRIGFNGYFVN